MAKQIKGNDIIEDGHLDNAIKESREYLQLLKEIDKQIIKNAQDLKTASAGSDTSTAKGIKETNKALQDSNRIKDASLKIDKQIATAETNLIALDKQRRDQLASVRLENQRKNQVAKEDAILTSKTSTAYQKQSVTLNRLRKSLKEVILTEGAASKAAQKLGKDVTKLNNRLVSADAAAGQFQRNVGNYPSNFKRATVGLKKFAGALGLLGGITLAIKAFKNFFDVVSAFDQSQADLASVLGITKDSMAALTEQAKLLGSSTKFTATEVAELQKEYAKLGFSLKEIENVTEATLQLAAAAGTDLANAATITGSTLRAFGLDSSETQRVVDVMAKSFSSSSLDIDKFKTAMGAVAPVAKNAGFTIEQTTALLGTLTDRGIDASSAGTGLRNVFLELSKRGITFEQAMTKIASATDKNAASLELFGKRGAVIGTILAESGADVDSLTEKLLTSGGAAEEMAKTQLDTLDGSLTKLGSAWEGFILSLESGEGTLGKLIRGFLDWTAALLGVLSGTKDAIKIMPEWISLWGKAGDSSKDFTKALKATAIQVLKTINIFARVADAVIFLLDMFGLLEGATQLFNDALEFLGLTEFAKELGIVAEETKKLTEVQKKNNDVNKRSVEVGKLLLKQNEDEIGDIAILLDAIQDENTTREEKNEIIAKLNADYPELIGNINLETASTEQLIAMKRTLIKSLLQEAIQRKKAEKQAQLSGAILDLEMKKIGQSTEVIAGLQQKIDDLSIGYQIIEEVSAKVTDNLEALVSTMNVTSPYDKTSDKLSQLRKELAGLREELEGTTNKLKRAEIQDSINRRLTEIAQLEKDRIAILDDGLDRENKSFKTSQEKKTGILKKETDKRVFIAKKGRARIEKLEREGPLTDDLADTETAFEIAFKKAREQQKKEFDARQEELKKMRDESLKIFKQITDGLQKNIDKRIDARKEEIADSQTEVARLQALADAGSSDAAESLKAEKANIAKEKLEIEKLEKKKRNLLIITTGLERASQLIGSGDQNPFKNAGLELGGFLSSLTGLAEGTDYSIGDTLGAPMRSGTDGHLIWADGEEKLLSIKNSRKLKGMHQDEITQRALAYDNDVVSTRAIQGNVVKAMNDANIVRELQANTKAIQNIRIVQQHIDLASGIETIKDGNKTIRNDHRPRTFVI